MKMKIPDDLILYRQGYTDQFDEWHSSNHWLGTVEVSPSLDYRLRVTAEVHVYGKKYRKRCRPVVWRMVLKMDRLSRDVTPWNGRGPYADSSAVDCKSLKDALSQARAVDLTPHITAILRNFYNPHEASCVWVKRRDIRPSQWERLVHNGWVPYATDFLSYDYNVYVGVGFFKGQCAIITRTSASIVECHGLSSWGHGGGPESDQLRSTLPFWLPENPLVAPDM
jgi:hypothetical protein